MPRLPVAREGWPFVLLPGVLAAGLALAGRRRLAAPFALASVASLAFFRDPDRVVPDAPGGVLAPADGRVVEIGRVADDFVGPAIRVAIFLSPLDVHVNRAPVAGTVVGVARTPGRYVPAYRPDAAEVNERCVIHLQGDRARVAVVQVAGVLARRISCRVDPGDRLAAGERFGMIRFGSRADCIMPESTEVLVRVGDRARGGVTVLGRLG